MGRPGLEVENEIAFEIRAPCENEMPVESHLFGQQFSRIRGEICGRPVPFQKIGAETDEREAGLGALRAHDGSREKAAETLRISPTTLWRKMTRLGITFETR
ncbi:MAG: hypothetical protein IIC32_06105 [Chloroflexi bacterium]|nr:hypothetical protein [Chloroflexota bacterium]